MDSLLVEDGRVVGVVETLGLTYRARAVLITTGTFLNGLIHIGECRIPAGRAGEFAATALAACLEEPGVQDGAPEDRHAAAPGGRVHRFRRHGSAQRRSPAPALFLAHGIAAPGADELLRHPHLRRHP